MVYELERVLWVCDGFFCSMSATYDDAVLISVIFSYFAQRSILVMWSGCRFLDTEVDASNPGNSMLCP